MGTTENIVLASVLASGMTVIENAAKEPEIIELCLMLNKMGADIHGMGTSKLVIYGVKSLKETEYMLASDRIVARHIYGGSGGDSRRCAALGHMGS